MYLCFSLSMPGKASWTGKWSGSGKNYVRAPNVGWSELKKKRAQYLIDNSPFFYSWSDGWKASIRIKEVDGKEARKIRRKTDGFCGYDWMIDSLLQYGKIYADYDEHNKRPLLERLESE